jgi:hypothetical protein
MWAHMAGRRHDLAVRTKARKGVRMSDTMVRAFASTQTRVRRKDSSEGAERCCKAQLSSTAEGPLVSELVSAGRRLGSASAFAAARAFVRSDVLCVRVGLVGEEHDGLSVSRSESQSQLSALMNAPLRAAIRAQRRTAPSGWPACGAGQSTIVYIRRWVGGWAE